MRRATRFTTRSTLMAVGILVAAAGMYAALNLGQAAPPAPPAPPQPDAPIVVNVPPSTPLAARFVPAHAPSAREEVLVAMPPVAVTGSPVRDLVVWDGGAGRGWCAPKESALIAPSIPAMARNGHAVVHLHGDGKTWAYFGWNWGARFPGGCSDISGMRSLLVAIRMDGSVKPDSLCIALICSPTKAATRDIDILSRFPAISDGAWHELALPLGEMATGSGFDLHTACEIKVSLVSHRALATDVYLDAIGFAR
jgi:hypothetical protein